MKYYLILFQLITLGSLLFAEPLHVSIGERSLPIDAPVKLELIGRLQNNTNTSSGPTDFDNEHIKSPKSANILTSQNKFYIHCLEGFETLVCDLNTFEVQKVISHTFDETSSPLFPPASDLGYSFYYTNDVNVFSGKPVESCFSHRNKYLWVTYYRRSFDRNATQPSGVAIIDTDTDTIVRVIPTGPLPKMLAASPDEKYVAITHWGDNTVGLIDVSSDDPAEFHYVFHFSVEQRLPLTDLENKRINRDRKCGFCLRGTAFSPDGKYLLVGRMYGGGIAFFNVESKKYLGTIKGTQPNLRHLIIRDGFVYLSANRPGYVQKAPLDLLIAMLKAGETKYGEWEEVFVGVGARTIDATADGQYIFAAVHNESKVVVIRATDMKTVATIPADSYPVGLDLSDDGKKLVVTSQARSDGGGNSVMIYSLEY